MHTYKIIGNESLTPSTTILTLESIASDRPFNYEPGQYAAISFFSHKRLSVARCFSIVSSPTQPGILQFAMRSGGRFTKKLSQLPLGEHIKVRGPFGGFVVDWQHQPNIVFIAGGIGITPFMSMLRFASQAHLQNSITLLYSCRSQDDIPFFEELIKIEESSTTISIHYVIADGPIDKLQGKSVSKGRISNELLVERTENSFSSYEFFICGPPPFMKGMTKLLVANNTPQNNIVTEAFGQGSHRQTGKIKSWPFNMYVLGTAGLVLGTFTVLVADVMKTMPVSSLLANDEQVNNDQTISKRQADLDAMVNSFDPLVSTGPPSDAVIAAQKAAQPKVAKTITTTSTQQSANVPVAKPTPVKNPVCTTSASGVRTCI